MSFHGKSSYHSVIISRARNANQPLTSVSEVHVWSSGNDLIKVCNIQNRPAELAEPSFLFLWNYTDAERTRHATVLATSTQWCLKEVKVLQ